MLAIEGDGRRSSRETRVFVLGLAASLAAGVVIALLPATPVPALVLALLAIGVGTIGMAGTARAMTVLGGIAYVATLQWSYLAWVIPIYAYSGLVSVGVGWPELLVISALCVLPATWLPTSLERPSDIVVWFLYLFGYVPACAIPIHLLGLSGTPVLPFTILVAIAFSTLGIARRVPPLRGTWRGLTEAAYTRVLVLLGLASAGYLLVVFGVPTGVPDFATVYDAREAYAAVASGAVGAGYLIPWAGNVVFPFLIALGVARWNTRLVAFGIGGALLIYATTGFKTVLFSIALVPLLYVLIRMARGGLGVLLAWSGAALVLLTTAATIVSGSIWPLALFVTRLLAVPGQMTAYYIDFFSSNPTYELSRSFLRLFNPSPYGVDPPFLVGAVYLDDPAIDANANLWADAMANYGFLGLIPFTIALGVFLWILDSAGAGRDILVIGPTLGLAGITLGNGALFTSILTLGLGLTVVLVTLLPADRVSSPEPGAMPRAP
ncbi:MAG TPA: hypothetical protein VFX65_13940 [Candidatus Limnocylindrales bacterium]|nr:hypothetical protein [Candidatus Limnocylindrales bacterium]